MNETWDVARYCDLLEAEIGHFVAVATGADPELVVPTCPGWTVADVVRRTGEMFQWVRAMVSNGQTGRPSFGVDLAVPATAAAYLDWMADRGAAVLRLLRRVDPARPMWTWGAEQSPRFWARRAQHDTAIHRADVELALNRRPGFSADVARDGIEEFLDNLPHAGDYSVRIAMLRGRGETLRFATPKESWLVTLTPEGSVWQRGGNGADVTATANVEDLLLLLWGRRSPSDQEIRVTGDHGLLGRWVDLSSFN